MSSGTDALRLKIEAVTVEMAEAAQEDDWIRTRELGDLRRNLLEALFSATDDPAEEVALIERILDADRMLASQARAVRSAVSEELAGHRHKHRALGAYREAASRDI